MTRGCEWALHAFDFGGAGGSTCDEPTELIFRHLQHGGYKTVCEWHQREAEQIGWVLLDENDTIVFEIMTA